MAADSVHCWLKKVDSAENAFARVQEDSAFVCDQRSDFGLRARFALTKDSPEPRCFSFISGAFVLPYPVFDNGSPSPKG